jgi:hypothetical protein
MQSKAQPPEPRLYAEYLPNIRQITLYISLQNLPSTPSPIPASATHSTSYPASTLQNHLSLSLSPSRIEVLLTLHNQNFHLHLPARVSETCANLTLKPSPTTHPVLTCPYPNDRELSFRLQADDSGSPRVLGTYDDYCDEGMQIPWSARDMSSQTRMRCRGCGNVFLGSRKDGAETLDKASMMVWKDLPSADWAEMMDLWHCHKPDEHEKVHGDGKGNAGECYYKDPLGRSHIYMMKMRW